MSGLVKETHRVPLLTHWRGTLSLRVRREAFPRRLRLQAGIARCIHSARQRNRARHASTTMSALEGAASLRLYRWRSAGSGRISDIPRIFGGDMSYQFQSLVVEASLLAGAAALTRKGDI